MKYANIDLFLHTTYLELFYKITKIHLKMKILYAGNLHIKQLILG